MADSNWVVLLGLCLVAGIIYGILLYINMLADALEREVKQEQAERYRKYWEYYESQLQAQIDHHNQQLDEVLDLWCTEQLPKYVIDEANRQVDEALRRHSIGYSYSPKVDEAVERYWLRTQQNKEEEYR